MRTVVAYEGRLMTNWILLPNAIQNEEDVVGVWVQRGRARLGELLGKARDFQRSQTGELSYDIAVPEEIDLSKMEVSLYLTNFVVEKRDHNTVVSSGIVRGVYFSENRWFIRELPGGGIG